MNAHSFDRALFRAHPPRERLSIIGRDGRRVSYRFPAYFADTEATQILLSADYAALESLCAPFAQYPVRISRDRALLLLLFFRYRTMSDALPGYDEFSVAVRVSSNRVPVVPFLTRTASGSDFGLALIDTPLDSSENLHRGTHLWGYPKRLSTLVALRSSDALSLDVSIEGRRCLRLAVALGGRFRSVAEKGRVYTVHEGSPRSHPTYLAGRMRTYSWFSTLASRFVLEWGDAPPYGDFMDLRVGRRPLLVRDFAAMDSVLCAPSYDPSALLSREPLVGPDEIRP